jgi:hypothetical protein
LQHCLQVERRAADDLEHVGGGGLLLKRFAQLVEQSRVLDRDNGLRREILHDFNLLVGKGTNFLTKDGERTDEFVSRP